MDKYREDNTGSTPAFTPQVLLEFSIKQKNYALFYSVYAQRAAAVDWKTGQIVCFAKKKGRRTSPATNTNFHHVMPIAKAVNDFGAKIATNKKQRAGQHQYIDSVANIALIEDVTNKAFSDILPSAALQAVPDERLALQLCEEFKQVTDLASAEKAIEARAASLSGPDTMNWFLTYLTSLPNPATTVVEAGVELEDALAESCQDVAEFDGICEIALNELTCVEGIIFSGNDSFDQDLFDSVFAAQF